ncbi:MAG TPA: hypothetical protein VJJ83_01160 [Candidatus Babeliales bacterium]|nr:hypothetical protein [Candidatus Babeliales bacterium]
MLRITKIIKLLLVLLVTAPSGLAAAASAAGTSEVPAAATVPTRFNYHGSWYEATPNIKSVLVGHAAFSGDYSTLHCLLINNGDGILAARTITYTGSPAVVADYLSRPTDLEFTGSYACNGGRRERKFTPLALAFSCATAGTKDHLRAAKILLKAGAKPEPARALIARLFRPTNTSAWAARCGRLLDRHAAEERRYFTDDSDDDRA